MEPLIKEERQKYPETFQRKVIEEYLKTGVFKSFLLKKYGIRYKGAIQTWMKQLGYVDVYQKTGALQPTTPSPVSAERKNISQPLLSQEARIKELERLLEDEQLRSEAYSKMIDIAEREFDISIRKKPNTK